MKTQQSRWMTVAAGALLVMAISVPAKNAYAQENTRKVISSPTPAYPEMGKRFHLAGSVKVQVVISAEGKITDVKVIGGHPILVGAVQDTLKSWKYAPANGETTATLQFNFHE